MLATAPEMLNDLKLVYRTYRRLASAISRYNKISYEAVRRHHVGEAINMRQSHFDGIQKLWDKHFR